MEIRVELSEDQAVALAQFLKRTAFIDYRNSSVDDDEAYLMRDAVERVRDALAHAGVAPR